jgi:endoglucanase
MPDVDHSLAFWTQVATTFKSDPAVIFDLFNEPYAGESRPTSSDWACWLNGCTGTFQLCQQGACSPVSYATAGMQQLLNAVRSTGANQPVIVASLNWAGDPCGLSEAGGNGGHCAWLSNEPVDPDNQLALSFHTYMPNSYCQTEQCWTSDVLPVADHVPVVVSEFGEHDCSAAYDTQFMNWADQHNLSYLAWAWEANSSSNPCSTSDLRMISDWNGTPNAPAGTAFQGHLAAVTP